MVQGQTKLTDDFNDNEANEATRKQEDEKVATENDHEKWRDHFIK